MDTTTAAPVVVDQVQPSTDAAIAPAPVVDKQPTKKKPVAASVSVLRQLKSLKTALRNDIVATISHTEQDGIKFASIRKYAKETLGDIAFLVLEKILEKAVALSKNSDRKTLSPLAIKNACCTMIPTTVSHQGNDQWKLMFNEVDNLSSWNAKYESFVTSADEARKKYGTGKEWKEATKTATKETKVELGKRKNDFALKSLNLYIRPTLMVSIAKCVIPDGIRVGGFFVGIAMATALNVIFDHLSWAIIQGNPSLFGKEVKTPHAIDATHVYSGIQASEAMKQILADLLVIGGPLGLLANTTISKKKKKAAKKSIAASASADNDSDDSSSDSGEEEEEDDAIYESESDDDDDDDSSAKVRDDSSSSESEDEDDSDEDEDESEDEKPKKRKASKISRSSSSKKKAKKSSSSTKRKHHDVSKKTAEKKKRPTNPKKKAKKSN